MSAEINYKNKYEDLKNKFMNSVDVAYRLGFADGSKQAQQDAQQQQTVDAQSQQQGQPGQSSQGGDPGESQNGDSQMENSDDAKAMGQENPQGSELDQHIAKLEGMLGKSETSPEELQKTMNTIKALRKTANDALTLKKSHETISGIAQALHKPVFKMGQQAMHNLDSNAKTAVNMQERIVSDLMKKWNDEETKASKNITAVLGLEGHLSKE